MNTLALQGIAMKREKALLPDRYPQTELFICDVGDVPIKDDMASMEHPIFALSTRPSTKSVTFSNGEHETKIVPDADLGFPTIMDKDLLIFAISKLMDAKKRGEPISRVVRFDAYDFLVFSNRGCGGRSYKLLRDSMSRLVGAKIETNVKVGGKRNWTAFHLVDRADTVHDDETGRLLSWEVVLSDWIYRAVESNDVLTLSPEYFRLRKPIERRIYEIARKHCGQQDFWKIGLEKLQVKCGSKSAKKHFKAAMVKIEECDILPDYHVRLEDDFVIFTSLGNIKAPAPIANFEIVPSTYETAKLYAPKWCPRYLEEQWRNWVAFENIDVKKPDLHYLKFCETWYEKRGAPS